MPKQTLSLKKSLTPPIQEEALSLPPPKDDWEVLERYLKHPIFGKQSGSRLIQECLEKKVHPLLTDGIYMKLSVSEIHAMLDLGLSVNPVNKKGVTPLIHLINSGARIHERISRFPPRIEYVEVLLRHGADCLAKASLPNIMGVSAPYRNAYEMALVFKQASESVYNEESWNVICDFLGPITLKKALDDVIPSAWVGKTKSRL